MKHKHYDLILAWANGDKIEYRDIATGIDEWRPCKFPCWYDSREYRIMEEPEKTLFITGQDGKQREYKEPITNISVAIQLLPTYISTLYYSSVDSRSYYVCISRDYLDHNDIKLDTLCSRGILHKTRKNAIQHTHAMLGLDYVAENFLE